MSASFFVSSLSKCCTFKVPWNLPPPPLSPTHQVHFVTSSSLPILLGPTCNNISENPGFTFSLFSSYQSLSIYQRWGQHRSTFWSVWYIPNMTLNFCGGSFSKQKSTGKTTSMPLKSWETRCYFFWILQIFTSFLKQISFKIFFLMMVDHALSHFRMSQLSTSQSTFQITGKKGVATTCYKHAVKFSGW